VATAPTLPAKAQGRLSDAIAALAAVVLPLAAYLRTLAPAEVGGDAGEFQFVPAVLGIPHYTGYPLYTLLGRLWIALDPFGTTATRMNLLSALCGALACGLVYGGVRTLGGGRLAGLAGAAALAIAPLEWRWSTIAGVRAAAAAFTALVLLLAFRWGVAAHLDPTDARRRRWLWLCFGLGLALAHHRSSAFFLPALGVYALLVAPRFLRQWRLLLLGLLVFALPLLLYLYLPIRSAMGAAYDQFHPTTWPNFVELVFAPHLSKALLSIPPAEYPPRALLLGQALRAQLGPFTWFAALGLAVALRFRQAELTLGAVFGLLVCAQVVDWNIPGGLNVVYLIPVLVVCAYLVAAGVEGALALLGTALRGTNRTPERGYPAPARAKNSPDARPPILPIVPASAAIVLALVVLATTGIQARRTYRAQQAAAQLPLDAYHQDLTAGWRGHRLATAAMPYLKPDAVIAADWEQATIFWYQKLVARTLPAVAVDFGAGSLADLSPATLARRYPGRPIYLARSVPWAAGHHPSAAGPLIGLSDAPRLSPPPGITPLPTPLEGGFQLLGYQLFDEQGRRVTAEPAASPVLPIMLVWQAQQRQTHNLSVSLRLLDAAGAMVRSADNSSPVYGLAPTSTWSSGEVVSDYYELALAGLPPGVYRLQVLLYYQPTPGTFHNLQALAPGGAAQGTGIVLMQVRR
jgi:hypothetical protein